MEMGKNLCWHYVLHVSNADHLSPSSYHSRIFMANIGHLHKPVTKNNWAYETRTHLFSHSTMEREAQLVDAFQEDGWSTGMWSNVYHNSK